MNASPQGPVDAARVINLPVISSPKGSLTFIEALRHVPFEIARVYYLYDVPGGEERGAHAHKSIDQFIIAVSGSFDVVIDDGRSRTNFFLNRSDCGLYVPRMLWRELRNFSSGSVCLALASAYFAEADYIRDYAEYIATVGGVATPDQRA